MSFAAGRRSMSMSEDYDFGLDEDFDDDDDPLGTLIGIELWLWEALQTYLLKRQLAGDLEASKFLKELEDNTFEIE